MTTCKIQWIDDTGHMTPDNSPAIGECRCKAHVEQIEGRGIRHEASGWFPICAEHAKQLNEPGMHNWEFAPTAESRLDRNKRVGNDGWKA
jgi:hypothetical protein